MPHILVMWSSLSHSTVFSNHCGLTVTPMSSTLHKSALKLKYVAPIVLAICWRAFTVKQSVRLKSTSIACDMQSYQSYYLTITIGNNQEVHQPRKFRKIDFYLVLPSN